MIVLLTLRAPVFCTCALILRSLKVYLQNLSSFVKIKLKKEYRWIEGLFLKQEAFVLMFLSSLVPQIH